MNRPRIALLSNPKSTGNLAQLPRIRAFCADHPDIFHYEVEHAHQVGEALKSIARVKPKVLAINGGDGTVQAALTEIHESLDASPLMSAAIADESEYDPSERIASVRTRRSVSRVAASRRASAPAPRFAESACGFVRARTAHERT